MKNFIITFLTLFICIPIIAQKSYKIGKLKKRSLVSGISSLVPKDFDKMSDEDLAFKYPSTKKPTLMLTSPDRNADFGVNISKGKFPCDDINMLHLLYKANIVQSYNNAREKGTVEFIEDGVKLFNNIPYAYYEYTTYFAGIRQYHIKMYTQVKNFIIVYTFTSDYSVMKFWQEPAKKMMASMKTDPKAVQVPKTTEVEEHREQPAIQNPDYKPGINNRPGVNNPNNNR